MTEDEAKAAYIGAIRRGCSEASARYAARINEIEYRHWLNTDEDFVWDIRRARYELEGELLDKLRAHKDSKATMALLERTSVYRKAEESVSNHMVYDPQRIVEEWAISNPEGLEALLLAVRQRLGKV